MRKNFLLSFCLLFVSSASFSQIWLELGPKANFGLAGYYNSAIASDDNHDFSLGMAYSYGGVVGFNIGDYHGFNVEALWGTFFQDVTYRENGEPTRSSLEWDVVDIYALYRYYPPSGMYFELGPKLSNISKISQTFGPDPVDVKGQYEDSYISGVLGFGAFLSGSEVLVIKAGLRFEYGFTDFVSTDGVANNYPAYYSTIDDIGKTNPYRVSFGLEVSFGVGGFAKGACGRRGFVLGGRYR